MITTPLALDYATTQTAHESHSSTQETQKTPPLQASVTMDFSHIVRNITSYTSVFSSADTDYHENLSNPHSTLLIVIFLGVTLLVVFVLFIVCTRREDNYFNRPSRLNSRLNAKRIVARPNKYDELQKLKYPTEKLDIIEELGEGVFGLVYKARAPGLLAPHETATVAVKMIRSSNQETPTKMCDLQREANLLSTFNHKNIIQLLGICTDSEKVNDTRAITCLLFEYMDGGDLCAYLRKHGPNKEFFGGNEKRNQAEFGLLERDKLAMCTHIACGMQYLSERNFIHRDLATRNCLISAQDFNIKIADFGLSRQTYQSDYYKAGDTESLPIRWMSPEAILYGRYSPQSDVWAFGVTVWEIYSYALQPYFSLSNEEVICCVCQGKILSPPQSVPPWMFNLMQLCWQHSPENRPKFSTIHSVLQAILLNDGRPPNDVGTFCYNLPSKLTSEPGEISESKERDFLPPPEDFRSGSPEMRKSMDTNNVSLLPSNRTETSLLSTNTRSQPLRRVVSDAACRPPVRPSLHRFSHASLPPSSSLFRVAEVPQSMAYGRKSMSITPFTQPVTGPERTSVA